MKKTTKKTTKVTKPKDNDNEEYYTKEEMQEMDKYHELTGHKLEDEEVYEVMQKHHNDEKMVLDELNLLIRDSQRGEEFNWQEVGKSKIIKNLSFM